EGVIKVDIINLDKLHSVLDHKDKESSNSHLFSIKHSKEINHEVNLLEHIKSFLAKRKINFDKFTSLIDSHITTENNQRLMNLEQFYSYLRLYAVISTAITETNYNLDGIGEAINNDIINIDILKN